MVTYLVTLFATNYQSPLSQLIDCLGEPNASCFTLGSDGESYSDHSRWGIESEADEEEPLEAHLDSIREQFDFKLLKSEKLPDNTEIELDIAAFFDDACCSVYLSAEWTELIGQYGIKLAVSCYPSDFGQPDDKEDVPAM